MISLKNLTRTIAVTAAALMLVFALAGCGGVKETVVYWKQVQEISTEISDATDNFNAALEVIELSSEDSKQAVLAAIDEMEDGYNKLSQLKAPKKFTEAQEKFQASSAKAVEALGIYREAFQGMSDEWTQEDLIPLQEGDTAMEEAERLFQEGQDKAEEIMN